MPPLWRLYCGRFCFCPAISGGAPIKTKILIGRVEQREGVNGGGGATRERRIQQHQERRWSWGGIGGRGGGKYQPCAVRVPKGNIFRMWERMS